MLIVCLWKVKKIKKMNDILNTIIGAANVEQNVELNGNTVQNTGKPAYNYYEGKIVDKNGHEVGVNAFAPASPYTYKYFCHLDDKPLTWEQIQNLDPKIRSTKGLYMIKYTPIHSKDYRKGRAFKIGQDLIRWDIRVSGPKEWNALCDKIPEFGWLRRNSTLSDGMFRLAKLHPGMSFWFSVDWLRYEAKLNEQAGTVLENPFGARKASVEEYKKIKGNGGDEGKTLVRKNFGDVLKEINDAERLPEVQEEMLENSGVVYHRGRNTLRDPVTGQFLKHKKEGE